ncbi:SpoIIE family protein phosphatase [Streptomyces avermitilis]|uniref:SpoIIE family protein phosphatase n=1 Tax=Streptomyces avermitilis TaxID=33903 RepID=UPI0033C83279
MHFTVQGIDTHSSVWAELAAAVVGSDGTISAWSPAAAKLVGQTAIEVCGKPVGRLLADASLHPLQAEACPTGVPEAGRALLRRRSGDVIDIAFRALPLENGSDVVVLAAPTRQVTDWEHGAALLHSLLAQDQIAVTILDADLRLVRANGMAEIFGSAQVPLGSSLGEILTASDAEAAEAALRQVLRTGAPVIGYERPMRARHVPGRRFTLSAFRLEDGYGHPTGVVTLITDATQQYRSYDQLELLQHASARIGRSLEVKQTALDLVDTLVPAMGDVAWANLAEGVFDGDEPPKLVGAGDPHLRRAALASATEPWPTELLQPGAAIPPYRDTPGLRRMQHGGAVILSPATAIALVNSPGPTELFVPKHGHSAMWAPLYARGLVLGSVTVWRTKRTEPFDMQDADLLTEITSRAALSVDNARRYIREHRAAVALQQRLLPRATTETPAADTAGLYLPAGDGAEISGEWFNVIPLPSLRTAFVVGDVVGHGLHAAATMGRLCTAVQTLADLELDPTELLTHLDDVVTRLAAEARPEHRDTVGATCLYATYDPITGRCLLASAGHPPPILVQPNGTAQVVGELSPGPPLGVGGMPFETTALDLAPGSVLALYTDGLIQHVHPDPEVGLARLSDRLATSCRPGRPLEEVGRAVIAHAADSPPHDDITLLLARTRALPPEATAAWDFPGDPAVVTDARKAVTEQLAVWELDDLAFTTELVVSELVTNAVRYAAGPVGVRLIRDEALICEVTDTSNTQPRLRRARWSDEGGRGLFLIAQLTTRWGCRYGQAGKTIWAEQPLAS